MMPAAILAIGEALAREDAPPAQSDTDSVDQDPDALRDGRVTLRQRAGPFVEKLNRAHAENAEIDWSI